MCYLPCYLLSLLLIIPNKSSVSAAVGDKSRQKCKEYANAVYSNYMIPPLSIKTSPRRGSECGIVGVPLIAGGVKAQVKEFPHMAAIGYQSRKSGSTIWLCGGSLISDCYILTAGHCLYSREHGPSRVVLLGAINVNQRNRYTLEIPIAERLPHPRYKPPARYDDIALIRLQRPVSFNSFIRPACLNTFPNIGDKMAIATGFGMLSSGAQSGSVDLMKVQLSFFPSSRCKTIYKASHLRLPHGVDDSMLCVGSLTAGRDTCEGDSGGPLQTVLDNPYCMYNIIGVTSFGKVCGFADLPAVYTKVSDYLHWIESIVWP